MTAFTTNSTRRGVGLFRNRSDAEQALIKLSEHGFDMDKVSIVNKDSDPEKLNKVPATAEKGHNQVAETAGKGATAGGIGGGALGLIAGLGILAIPGVGAVAELGVILANTVLGGAIGAAGGGLVGALVGWGLSEDKAQHYQSRVYDSGDYLLLIEGSGRSLEQAERILSSHNIHDWHTFDGSDAIAHQRPRTASQRTAGI
ncbi:MAG: hypothetical protein AAFQ40_09355 [Cyanobacteria bacterium J06623_5]